MVFFHLKEKQQYLKQLLNYEIDVALPMVIVRRTSEGTMPIELEDLAFRLQGAAHVLGEGKVNLSSDIGFYEEDDKRPGKIYIVFPNRNMRVRVMNLKGEKADNPDLISMRIVNEIYEYTNQILRYDIDTWEGIQTKNLHTHFSHLKNIFLHSRTVLDPKRHAKHHPRD